MLIYERSVTKQYWQKFYKYFYRKLQRGHYENVKKLDGLQIIRIDCGKDCVGYAITIEHEGHLRPIAWLYLWKKPGWAAWEVMQVYVFEKARGQGLAKRLYEAAINTDGLLMASGKTQSWSSRALWKSFIQNEMFDLYAIDYKNFDDRSQVFWDDECGEIWCSLPIYAKMSEPRDRDVRIIAARKQR